MIAIVGCVMSKDLTYAVEQRLRFIDFLLHEYGQVKRKAITGYFGIGSAAASRDFGAYKKLCPENMLYAPETMCYVKSPGFVRHWG